MFLIFFMYCIQVNLSNLKEKNVELFMNSLIIIPFKKKTKHWYNGRPRTVNNLFIYQMGTPRCQMQKDTKGLLLRVTVAIVTETKDIKIEELNFSKAILEGVTTNIIYQRY